MISQDQIEALLREALAAYGVPVEWGTTLAGLTQNEGEVTATLHSVGIPPETVRAAYVAGCDGARSAVRHALNIGFAGGTYEQLFFVADTVTEGLEKDAEAGCLLQVSLAPRTFHGFFPMLQGRTRIIGLLPDGLALETATFADVRPTLEAAEHIRVREVSWFSTYRVHHRVAENFRQGRAFLVGDAGHVHSPVGGQGMNTDLGDAANLGWKLATVLRGTGPAALLATYEAERMPFARQLVATTDRAFTAATQPSAWASFLRTQLAPRLLPLALRLPWFQQLLFRTVSQTGISYPNSPLSRGHASEVGGGMRLPWSAERYEALRPAGWHMLCAGPAPAGLTGWAKARGVPLLAVPPTAAERSAAVYLVRPDGYVGLAAASFSEATFSAYARQWGLISGEQ